MKATFRERPLSPGLKRAAEAAGSLYRLADLLGIRMQSIWQWHEIPINRVVQVEAVTGVPREKLRPDLYR